MSHIYILLSLKDQKTYVGSTTNLNNRFRNHKLGKVKSTKNRRPLTLLYSEYFDNYNDALRKEKYYKTAAGRKKLRRIIDPLIKEYLKNYRN